MSGGGSGSGAYGSPSPYETVTIGELLQIAFDKAVAEGRRDFANVVSEISPHDCPQFRDTRHSEFVFAMSDSIRVLKP